MENTWNSEVSTGGLSSKMASSKIWVQTCEGGGISIEQRW